MKDSMSGINWKYIFLTIFILALIPFPTELVPESRFRVVDAKNQPLPYVATEQEWKSYTFFNVGGLEERCTDSNGVVVYPRRMLWASAFSRVAFPVLAQIGTIIHGSAGTISHFQVFDKNYISDFQNWREEEFFYAYKSNEMPAVVVAKPEFNEFAKSCGR
jgi:hypothetical protein